jgi:hypothetical protein
MLRALLVLAAGLCVGCEPMLDTRKLEKNIDEEISRQANVKAKSVTCPEEQKEQKGGTFDCTIEHPDGTKMRVEVAMKGDGQVEWKLITPKAAGSASAPPADTAATADTAKPATSAAPGEGGDDKSGQEGVF